MLKLHQTALPRGLVALGDRFVLATDLPAIAEEVRAGGAPLGLVLGSSIALPRGPRAAAATASDEVVVATADQPGLSFLRRTDAGWGLQRRVELTSAPVAVAAAEGALYDLEGLSAEGTLRSWRSSAIPLEETSTLTVAGAERLLVRDLDGDGALDVALLLPQQKQVALKLGPSEPVFFDVCGSAHDLVARRAADGQLELVVACEDAQGLVVADHLAELRAGGAPRLRAFPYGGTLYALLAADFDLDGVEDLAATDLSGLVLIWPGGDLASPPRTHQLDRGLIALAAADVDGDSDLDLAVIAYETRTLELLVNGER
ncbi:MAG: VCBS repeat-containing protein [Myxococcota bacterium]